MAVVTEIFQGQFNLEEYGVKELIQALDVLNDAATQVGKSLNKVTISPPKIDTVKIVAPIQDATAKVDAALKKIEVNVQSTVDLTSKSFQEMTEIVRSQFARLPDKTASSFFKLKDQYAGLVKLFHEADSAGDMQRAIEGMKRLSFAIEETSVVQAKVKSLTQETQKQLRSQADAIIIGDKVKSLSTEFENVRKSSNLTTVSIKDRWEGVKLAFSSTGSSLQGVREVFAGTNKSINPFILALDGIIKRRDPIAKLSSELTQSISTIARATDDSIRSLQSQQAVLKRVFTKEVGEGVGAFERFNEQLTKTNAAIKQVEVTALAGGNIATGIIRARVEVEGLKTQYSLLKQQGILPAGSSSETMFLNMIQQAESVQSRLQAMAGRYDNVKQKIAAAKVAQEQQAASGQKQISVFGRVSISLKNLFSVFNGGNKTVQQATQTMQTFENRLQGVANQSNVLRGAFLGSFGGTFLANLLGNFSTVFGGIKDEFFSLNNTIQNTNITIAGMLEGSSVNAKDAIAGFTEFIEGEVAKTPFEFADAIDAALRLTQQGFDPQLWFRPAANAAAAMNKPMEQFIGGMTKLVGGARGAAIDMFRDFGLNVNNISGYFDKATGKALEYEEVQRRTAEGTLDQVDKLSFAFDKQGSLVNSTGEALDIMNAYLTQNATFAKAAESRSHSLTGVISNLKDAFSKILIAVGQPIFERLTSQAAGLLGVVDRISPTLTVFASNIGLMVGQGIDNLVYAFQNAQTTVNNFFTSFESVISFFTSIISGDWPTAWATFQAILLDAIDNSINILADFASQAFDWGVNLVSQLADGIIQTASDLIVEAMNYITSLIAGPLEAQSPPKEGPLKEIDTWGQNLMNTFTDSMGKVDTSGVESALGQIKNVFNEFDLVTAQGDVSAIQQQILGAEAKGFIPAELKKQLQLAQQKVSLIQANLQLQQQLNQEQKKEPAKQEAKKAGGKGGGGGTGGSKDRVGAEKKTALQIRNEALSVLDQQLKDGVIKHEDYIKEKHKIYSKFYQDSLEAGLDVNDKELRDSVNAIHELDAELEKINAKKKKGDKDTTPFTPPTVQEIFGKFADQAEKAGEETGKSFVAAIKVSTTRSIDTVKESFTKKFLEVRDKIVESISKRGIDPKLLGAVLGITKIATTFSGVTKVLDRVVPGLKFLPGIFTTILARLGPLGAIIARLTGLALRFAGPIGIIVTVFLNWQTIVDSVTGTLDFFGKTVDGLVKRLGGPEQAMAAFNEVSAKTEAIFNNISTAFNKFGQQLSTEGIAKGLQDLFASFGKIDAKSLLQSLGNIFNSLGQAIVAALPEGVVKFFDQISLTVQTVSKSFRDFFSQGRLGGELVNLFKQLGELAVASLPALKGIATVFGLIAGVILNVVVSALQALVAAGPFIETALAGIVTVITGFVDIITGVGTGFQAAIAFLQGDSAKGTQLIEQSWTNLKEGIGNILTGLLQTIMGIGGTLLSFAVSFAGNFIANILQFIPGWQNTAVILRTITNEMITIMYGLVTQARDILLGLSNQLSVIISYGFKAALAAVLQFALDVIAYFQNLYDQIIGNSIMVDLVEGILGLLESMIPNAVASVINLVAGIVKKFSELKGKLITLGRQAMDGLIEGFNKKRDAVIDFLGDLALEALSAVGLAWAIKSPSIRFAELGVQAIAGLNQGLNAQPIDIAKNADDAADKAETLMKQTIEGSKARNIGDRIRRFFEDNYEKVISGQIDAYSELQKLILDKDIFNAIGIGEDQIGDVDRALKKATQTFFTFNQASKEAFVTGQTDLLSNIQKSVNDITGKFNQQFFNITSTATQARIELDKLFNRTVTDAEVERMAKAFEGTPVEQLSEQQRLILQNYILQQKSAAAAGDNAKVQAALAKFTASSGIIEQLVAPKQAQDAAKAGNEITKALGLGLDAGTDEVLSKLTGVTTQIIDKLKANLGIASPSTIAMGFGENFSFGLAKGIVNGIGQVDRAVGTLSGALNPNALMATAGGPSNLGSVGSSAITNGNVPQIVQYNTIASEFDMATFTATTERAIVNILRGTQ